MHIVIAIALLVMLLAHIRRKDSTTQPVRDEKKRDDLKWIDELEILDAVMDDYI